MGKIRISDSEYKITYPVKLLLIKKFFYPYKPSVLFMGQTNSVDPDQTSHNVTSDQGINSFAYRISFEFLNKNEKYHTATLKMEMDWSN